MSDDTIGKVYLVGAGPGDPGLLTLRGKACLERARVVVYDVLVSPEILRHASQAELIFVGKRSDRHSLPQSEINRVLVEQARHGRTVVRLKGGDPFIFGRGGEEAAALAEAGIPFEVVPGITAGTAVSAYAGIPLTQRGVASSVSFITGHTRDDDPDLELRDMLVSGSLVFYMGVRNLPRIVTSLLGTGRSPGTPVALVEWGTLARQRTVTGTLEDIQQRANEAAIEAPALIVVGDAVRAREQLSWFEARPLFGLRVATTHTEQRQGDLERRLLELGADVYPFPTLVIEPVTEQRLEFHTGEYDWIVLTSVNSADMLFDSLSASGRDARALAGVRLCAVGSAAVEAVEGRSLMVDAVAPGYRPHEVLAALAGHGALRGQRVLLPRADIARTALASALREAGASVTEVVAYETRPRADDREALDALRAFAPELVVFTNSSAASSFARVAGDAVSGETAFASIGPVTSRAAEAAGLRIAVEPMRHDIPNLIEAICAWRAKSVQR